MSFCTRCGRPRSEGARFCTSCGAPFPAAAAGEPGFAPQPATWPGREPPGQTAGREPFDWLYRDQASQPTRPYGELPVPPPGPVPGQFGTGQPAYPEPGPPYQELPPRRRSRAIVLLAGVILVLVAGGVGAWAALGGHSHPSAQPSHRAHPASTAPSPQPPASTPSTSPRPSPSSGLVSVAPGVGHPSDEPAVLSFLNRYFTAINHHDYQQYYSLLDPQEQRDITEAQFRSGYRSTRDSGATLVSLQPAGPGTVAASITFTSHQPAAISPSHSTCTDWNTTLYLRPQAGSYVIGAPPSSYHASYHAC